MVLETRLICKNLLAAIMIISSGCAANDSKVTDHASISGYDLTLKASKDSCLLESKIGDNVTSTNLKVEPPCYFLRQENRKLQSFSYENIGVLSVIMVIGSPISEKKKEKWTIEEDVVCGESRQGVLFKESGIAITEKILEGGVVCKDKGADEKDFWYFAH
jgi:hypothetical protein